MKMAKGVTLHQGGGMKSGPPLTSARDNMSRRDTWSLLARIYHRHLQLDHRQTLAQHPPRTARTDSARSESGFTFRKDWGMNPPSAMKQVPYEPPIRANPKAKTPRQRDEPSFDVGVLRTMRWIVTHIAYTVLEVLLKMHILFCFLMRMRADVSNSMCSNDYLES